MRTAVITLSMIALVVAAWLATRRPSSTWSAGQLERTDDASVSVTGGSDLPLPQAETSNSARAAVEADLPDASADAPTKQSTEVPAVFRSVHDEPEYRAALVGFLVGSGLSAADSERISDAAIKRLGECAATYGFGRGSQQEFDTCHSNVFQQAGVPAAVHRRATIEAGSEMARRKALEAAAAATR